MQVDHPDEVVVHHLETCPDCHANLADAPAVPGSLSRRQVFEMPPPKVIVTEHQSAAVTCPGCGKCCRAPFPASVSQPVQYGPHLLGFATYLSGHHLVPFARSAEIVQQVTGAPVSAGTIARAVKTVHKTLAPFETAAKAALAQAPILHVDETGTRTAGKLHWFHVRCTKDLTLLFRHEKRGGEACADLADYTGTLVSDFWSSYVTLTDCRHAYCGTHLLREFTFQHEVKKQDWAKQLIEVFESGVSACHQARERGAQTKGLWDANRFAARFDESVAEGLRLNPPPERGRATKAVCLLERLNRHRDDCLRFLRDLSIPFTNNQAERDVRVFKSKGKISGGFRTTDGADQYCRLRSYAATCRKQNLPILTCFKSLFHPQLIMPVMMAE